jgi:hypothetical protein
MIKLMNAQKTHTSAIYSHTGSDTGTVYTITHNFGAEPDFVKAQALSPDGLWVSMGDLWQANSGHYYGCQAYSPNNADKNITKIYVYQFDYGTLGATRDVRFICEKLGPSQTITNITPAFQWSSSEQVYPFERDIDGRTLYCKEVNMGTLASNGAVSVAHNIPNYDPTKIHKIEGIARATSSYDDYSTFQLGLAGWTGIQTGVVLKVYISNIIVFTPASYYNNYTGVVRIIYAK